MSWFGVRRGVCLDSHYPADKRLQTSKRTWTFASVARVVCELRRSLLCPAGGAKHRHPCLLQPVLGLIWNLTAGQRVGAWKLGVGMDSLSQGLSCLAVLVYLSPTCFSVLQSGRCVVISGSAFCWIWNTFKLLLNGGWATFFFFFLSSLV